MNQETWGQGMGGRKSERGGRGKPSLDLGVCIFRTSWGLFLRMVGARRSGVLFVLISPVPSPRLHAKQMPG